MSSKRENFTLARDEYNSMNNIVVQMTNSEEEAKIYLTFRARPAAYTLDTGNKDEVRNQLAEILKVRLQSKIDSNSKSRGQCEMETVLRDGYITLTITPDKVGSQVMYSAAEEAMKSIGMLTSNGVTLKAALSQVLEASKAQAKGQFAPIALKMELNKETAESAIGKAVECVMPKKDAEELSRKLGTEVVAKFPIRPAIPYTAGGDPISNRGTLNDPLYKLVHEACNRKVEPHAKKGEKECVIPDEHKRRYAVGEIFDALEAAYDGLGKEIAGQKRMRA